MADAEHPLQSLNRRLQTNYSLSDSDSNAILALPFKLRTLEASTYIVREGEIPRICSVLITGFAFRQKLTGEGARQIIALHIPGEALDFQNLFLDVSDHNVQMLTRGQVAEVPITAFQEIAMERPAVGRAILITTLIEASIFREWVLNIGRRDSRTRLAHLLCEFALRLEAQGLEADHGYVLPMTQEQIADATGLTPVHVNRVLKTMECEGLIVRNRRNISFPDWHRLREVGDFNQRYLHLEAGGPRPY
ncbi:Crp/Fnr family transcriptional regulator [Sphingomonas sp. M1-B02]|uniref:Crp/Fnr family transcriptional regulator n=1 Tax=Sphingomonas sp. M1-B02 TaxID=3114300 RepID=UPI00223F9B1E|nr:Crp/Fnr family transcriptional regulator [Sphingomonas sp. S6-11]UZK67440.1 Crp/Fnr family transcriptional regulator [Sphingomonas sp. S6-11]